MGSPYYMSPEQMRASPSLDTRVPTSGRWARSCSSCSRASVRSRRTRRPSYAPRSWSTTRRLCAASRTARPPSSTTSCVAVCRRDPNARFQSVSRASRRASRFRRVGRACQHGPCRSRPRGARAEPPRAVARRIGSNRTDANQLHAEQAHTGGVAAQAATCLVGSERSTRERCPRLLALSRPQRNPGVIAESSCERSGAVRRGVPAATGA